MYPDLDQSEVVFVHKLASGEPTARSRALKKLHAFLKQRSADKDLTAETFRRLSKGLHYAMWMQDKQILQEELAENMASLIDDFQTHEEGALYVQVFFEALSGEWHLVDRWRMDKFLMAVRLLVRKIFNVMLQEEWAADVVNTYLSTLKKTIISSKSTIVQSLKTHFASLYLVELSKTGKVSKEVSQRFLEPYLEVLQENRAPDFYFQSICDEVFQTLVYTASYEVKKSDIEERDSDGEDDSNDIVRILRADNPISCDFEALGDRLFDIGAQPTVNSKRRQRLYALSKKFKAIAQGKNPRKKPMNVSNKPVISQSKMKKAAQKLLDIQEKLHQDREKHKKEVKEMKKKENAAKIAELLSKALSSTKEKKKLKSSNKFKPNAIKKKNRVKSSRHVTKGKVSKLPKKH